MIVDSRSIPKQLDRTYTEKFIKLYNYKIPMYFLQVIKEEYPEFQQEYLYEFYQFVASQKVSITRSSFDYQCSYCGETMNISYTGIKSKISKKFNKEKYCCSNSDCIREHKRDVIKDQTKQGKCSAVGKHIMPENWGEGHRNSEKVKAYNNWRRGKSVDEICSIEGAKNRREAAKKLCIENPPHKGHKHSEKTIQVMKNKKEDFLKEKAYEKNYEHPITKEKIDWYEQNSIFLKLYHKNLSEEQKLINLKNQIKGMEKSYRTNHHKNWNYHIPWWRSLPNEVTYQYDEAYQSLYEKAYYEKLDSQKKFYRNNNTIYLPYIHPKDNKIHQYIPDVLIYEDINQTKLIKIVEVKPYEFAYNPKGKQTEYYIVTKRKLEALKVYCEKNNFFWEVITERDLDHSDVRHLAFPWDGNY